MPLVVLLGLDIGSILVWGVGLAFCLLVVYIAKAFFGLAGGLLGKLPVVGGWIDSGLTAIEHKITSFMGSAAGACDARIGGAFHELARLIDWIGRELNSHANLIHTVLTAVLGQRLGALFTQAITSLLHRTHTQAAQIAALNRTVGLSNARAAHGHGEVVLPRIRTAERGLIGQIEHDIAGLRARARTTENSLARLWHRIRGLDKVIVTTAFVGAVSVALARMGLGWLRCSSLRSLGKSIGCGGWKLLEDLLAGVIDVLVIADLCQLTKLLIEVAESSEVQSVISGIIAGMDELLLCQNVTRPAALDGYESALPPQQTFAALPAV